MKVIVMFVLYILWLLCLFTPGNSWNDSQTRNQTISFSNVEEVNSVLRKIIVHFKNSNASSQSLPIPDPFHRPDQEYEMMLMKIKTTNVTVWGVSKLKIRNFNSDLVALKISFDLHLPSLLETGNYRTACLFGACKGNFSVKITNAHWNCRGALKITKSGHLAVSNIELDLKQRDDMKINFENAGFIGDFVNKFGDMIFEGMKTYVLSVIDINIENYINEQLKHMKIMLPNSIPPIDTFAIEARNFIKNFKYDPHLIPDFSYASNLLLIQVSQISIHGISSFYRTGNISVSVQSDYFRIILNFGTGQLRGDCQWEIGMLGFDPRSGNVFYDVDYVNVSLIVDQSFDLSQAPVITDINVKVGNIQMHLDGYSIFEYVIEFAVNLISNWLRNHIIVLFKTQIVYEVQGMVNKINMEDIILKHFITEKAITKTTIGDSIDLIMKSPIPNR